MGGANSYDDEQDYIRRDRGKSSFKLQAARSLPSFLAVHKLRAGKVSRQSRTARQFNQLHCSATYLQSVPQAVRLDMLGCDLNCTLGLSSCSHTERASSQHVISGSSVDEDCRWSVPCSSTSADVSSHLLKPTGTWSRSVSSKTNLGNISTMSLIPDVRDQPRHHVVAVTSGREHLRLHLCNQIGSSHHNPQLPHGHTTGRNQATVCGQARAMPNSLPSYVVLCLNEV